MKPSLLALLTLTAIAPAWAASYYTVRLDDPKAVYLDTARGDGIADDTEAIQKAIDKVNQGVLFIPQGRYRLTRTLTVWPSTRLIGYGATRPVFVLAANTPGYSDPAAENYMVFFSGGRPGGRGGRGAQPGPHAACNSARRGPPPMPEPEPSTPP